MIDLNQIKQHLNIDEDFTLDDNLLIAQRDAAIDLIQTRICLTYDEIIEREGKLPSRLIQATLLLIGDWYDNRENMVDKNSSMPFGIQAIVDSCRDYSR